MKAILVPARARRSIRRFSPVGADKLASFKVPAHWKCGASLCRAIPPQGAQERVDGGLRNRFVDD
jgi:hypothetical protein